MPWTSSGKPVTIEALLTLVKEGRAPRARPRKPSTPRRCRFGMRPRAMAASRYSSAEPSRQMTTTGRDGGPYNLPLMLNGWTEIPFICDRCEAEFQPHLLHRPTHRVEQRADVRLEYAADGSDAERVGLADLARVN